MPKASRVFVRWLRDRFRSTMWWTFGLAATVVATAAFYPALEDVMSGFGSESSGLASLLGLSEGIDPSSPLGFLWSNLYANVVPWVLMALGISLGSNAIAGDEEGGTLEYLLSKPVTRTEVLLARFAGMVVVLLVVAVLSGISLAVVAPFVDLTTEMTSTAPDGTATVNPGVSAGDIAAGTVAAFAVGLGAGSTAFLLGAATGRKGLAMGVAAGIAVAGYLLYTLSNVTGDLEFVTWLSPWRWYVADAMFINGLTTAVLLPFGLACLCVAAGWALFTRRDLQS